VGISAQAEVIHDYLSQITEVPASSGAPAPGPLSSMESMTIDSGHLWIAEKPSGSSRVDEFDASTGAFLSQFLSPASFVFSQADGIQIGNTTGEAAIYIGGLANGVPAVGVFDEAGALHATWTGKDTPGKSFGSRISGIAVDKSTDPLDEGKGDVYVAVPSQGIIDVLHPEANGEEHYVGRITGVSPTEPFRFLSRMTVNQSNGDLIVLDGSQEGSSSTIDVFEPTVLGEYSFVHEIVGRSSTQTLNGAFDLAVDSGNGEIYVTEDYYPTVIDEFSSTGAYLGHITGSDSPGGNIYDVFSLGVDPESHQVYIADNRSEGNKAVKVFGPDVVIPDVTTGTTSDMKARSATLTGTVNPDKAGVATCQFLWGTTTSFGQEAACSEPVAEGESPVPVEAQLSELEPDTTYYYLLRANDASGTNPGESSEVQSFTTPGPRLDAAAVSAATAESVTFDATINPHKAPTSFYFQYGTTSSYGNDLPAPPGIAVGSGEGDLEFSRHVQGLQANTIYHYRVVMFSEVEAGKVEEFDGADQTFTTQRSGGALSLPDGRSWELVTPADKDGALIFGQDYGDLNGVDADPFVAEASADGDAMIDLASQPTEAEPQGNTNEASVLSTRGPSGWSSQVIALPHHEGTGPSLGNGGEYRFFSEDLSRGIVTPFGNFDALSPEATEATPYMRTDYLNGNVNEHCQTSCYRPLVTDANTQPGAVFGEENNGECEHFVCGPRLVDATPDASHIVMWSVAQLTSTSNERAEGKYFYEWSDGKLQPLYPLPKSEGGVGVYAGELSPLNHQLSDGGSVFFSNGGHLYVHDFAKDESVHLDVAQGVREPSEDDAQFLYASSDGSRVLFTDSKQLISAAGGGIYECRIVEVGGVMTCELELTGLSGGMLIGGSEDASYLYFLGAGGKLIVDHYDGREWTTTEGPFIGTQIFSTATTDHAADYKVSQNGRYLAFMSNEDLTGYDTRDAISGHADEEVYLYDAGSNRLVCTSCDPTGARPTGVEYGEFSFVGGDFSSGAWVASNLPPWTKALPNVNLYQPRFLSDSGRLFFDSNDALVPQDVNGTQDTYEYEPPGLGDCDTTSATYSERSGGCVNLISSGTSPEESAFMDASETGGDVFFITLAKLVSQDYDTALDVYDAHECTTDVPCYPVTPVSPPVCFTGDACKPAPSPQPSIFGPTSSATFSGAGNVVPSTPASAVKPKSLRREQKLTQALKACGKKGRKQRLVCERRARKKYGPAKKKSKKASSKRKGRG